MAWRVDFTDTATRQLEKLDRQDARRIVAFLRERVAVQDDPRATGKALTGSTLGRYWRYRVGDWRIVCSIDDGAVRILVVTLGNRREIYR